MKQEINKSKKIKETSLKDKKELANFIGEIVSQVYGVVGLTRVNTIKNQLILLKKENYVDGILILSDLKGKYEIDVHIIVAYGVKINEVINEVSKRIKYEVKKKFGDVFSKINVYVEDLLDL